MIGALLGLLGAALPEPTPVIHVAEDLCLEGVSPAGLERLLRLEVGRHLGPRTLSVTAPRCEAPVVEFDVIGPGRVLHHQLGVADTPPRARARVLALTISEWLETSPAPEVKRTARKTLVLSAGPTALHLFDHRQTLLGARADLAIDVGPLLLGLDVGGATTSTQIPIGEIEVGLVAVGVGAAFVYAGARYRVSAGPRLATGLGWVSGHTTLEGVSSGDRRQWVLLASAQARLQFWIGRWTLQVTCHAGGVIAGLEATADGDVVSGLSGSTGGVSLQLGADLLGDS